MCGSKQSVDVIEPTRTPRSSRSPRSASAAGDLPSTSSANTLPHSRTFTNTGGSTTSYSSSLSSSTTLSGIRASLPENPNIYDFSEISAATGGFLMSRFSSSSSSSSWRCSLRGRDAIVFQRKLRRQIDPPEIQQKLSTICRIHHSSLIKLLGASLSGNYIYLAYEFVHGVNLADCLRNSKNPSFTVLSTWLSRMQIATDVAHGLDYVHHCSGLKSEFVHNHINSSSIVVADGSLNAKICHFGTSELCGETDSETASDAAESEPSGEIKSESSTSGSKKSLRRSRSRAVKVEGTRGYMSPEFLTTGVPTQKCDVYAFGVVILELLSGVEPLKYRLDEGSGGGYQRVSVIETARGALEGGELRTWIDRRLKDSYPVDVAERIIRVGLDCVDDDPDKRPDMGRVAVLVSKLYLESKNWSEMLTLPTDFSVSLAPR